MHIRFVMKMSTSRVWQYFDKIGNSQNVICKECQLTINRNDSNTTSMIKHLKRKHSIDITAVNVKRKADQPTLTEVMQKKEKLDSSGARATLITKAIANFIVSDLQPLDVVNNVGFVQLMNVMEPR